MPEGAALGGSFLLARAVIILGRCFDLAGTDMLPRGAVCAPAQLPKLRLVARGLLPSPCEVISMLRPQPPLLVKVDTKP